MNKKQLDQRFNTETVDMATVSDELHRRLMRSVANVSSRSRSARSSGFVPVLAAGAMATVAAVLLWSNPGSTPAPITPPTSVAVDGAQVGVNKINQHVAALGSEIRVPEAALRKELQRLESDLKRFYVSS